MATVAELRPTPGRQPFIVVEAHLDSCELDYGVAPCVAAIPTTGNRECYNTFKTCQDKAHYTATTKVHTFYSAIQVASVADTLFDAAHGIPCVKGCSFVPTKVDRKAGLAQRASVSVQLMDTTHNDSGVDKYIANRTYPTTNGTYFSKLLARNPYYYQRKLVIKTGYLQADGTVDDDGLQESVYFIDKIDGPDANGNVTITGKDVLTFIDNDKVKLPAPTKLTLSAFINAAVTSITLLCADTSTDIPATEGYLCIDNEVMRVTVDSTDATHAYCTVVRGALNSTAATHDAATKAQYCYIIGEIDGVTARVDEVIYQVLVDGTVPIANIDAAGFTLEGDDWGSGMDFFGVITAPTGVKDIIRQITEQSGAYIWFDVREQVVKFRLTHPAISDDITSLNEEYNFVEQSLSVKVDDAERLTQVIYHYGILDPTRDLASPENYQGVYSPVNLEAGDPNGNEYRTARIRNIFGRWVPFSGYGAASSVADRMADAYQVPLVSISFRLDAKDAALWVGSTVVVDSRSFVDDTGTRKPQIALITEAKENIAGSDIAIVCQVSQDRSRFAIIMPDDTPDYDSASAEQRDPGGFIADDATETMLPDDPYLIA